jgi:hypothetical protein
MNVLATREQAPSRETTQGERDGREEARAMLDEATHQKDRPLCAHEIQHLYGERFLVRRHALSEAERMSGWFTGWCAGFVSVCLAAAHQAPDEGACPPVPQGTLPVSARFRRATLLVDDPQQFRRGILRGQMAYVDEQSGSGEDLTDEGIVADIMEIAQARRDGTSKSYLAGFVLGKIDALLRDRVRYPADWWNLVNEERKGGVR